MRPSRLSVIVLCMGSCLSAASGDLVPLRISAPPGSERSTLAVPVSGGVPFPRGALGDPAHARLLDADGRELPCQVSRSAVWPDGSVKWARIDAVLPPSAGGLALEYGPGVRRAEVPDGLAVRNDASAAAISGGGVAARLTVGDAILAACSLGGRALVAEDAPARLVVRTLRVPGGPEGLPPHTFICRDGGAVIDAGVGRVEELDVLAAGPVRATVRLRGHVPLEHFGQTLPEAVRRREPAGRLPFVLWLSFYRGCPVVIGRHRIVFSGEPDKDFIARWAVELPGRGGERGQVVLEPGVELHQRGGRTVVAEEQTRLCWAPIDGGLAVIRRGWENRPCGVTHAGGSAWIDFWPARAGVWDLRRYAREWAVGESGDTRNPDGIRRYATWAARGLAKSHDFALSAGTATDPAAAAAAAALAGPTLLVAPPGWTARSGAVGALAAERDAGVAGTLDATFRRRIDYHLFCQDLFRWHGKLAFGFWQTRYGQVHRSDRWERDYGRWGWSLNDGAGRIGHLLALQFLRTLDRRYYDAAEAFCRANYDTAMVHTAQHMENTGAFWTVRGCTHRHNVQPFGCPYIGMRGSNPQGQRIVHLLAGDEVIGDGLDVVAEACFRYATDQRWRLGVSGGGDGQGSAACAMLWKYETTGDTRYLDACRTILDRSGLVPPEDGRRLGYGPDFGLFHAAVELAELTGDAKLRARVVEVARMGLKHKDPARFLYAIAAACRWAEDDGLKEKLRGVLDKLVEDTRPSLAELPASMWPGHAGYRTNALRANVAREVPAAVAALDDEPEPPTWPDATPPPTTIPAAAPKDWFRPGGATEDTAPASEALLTAAAGEQPVGWAVGDATWTARKDLADSVRVGAADCLAGPVTVYADLARLREDPRLAESVRRHIGRVERIGSTAADTAVASGTLAGGRFVARLRRVRAAEGADGVRIELAARLPAGAGRVASWGLLVPLRLGRNRHAIQTTAPGRFRLERCRLDQNDERIPNWLTSETRHGKGAPLWPLWRLGGISVGPGRSYRVWRANRGDCSALFCDQGPGPANWFDVTDRTGAEHRGLTVRLLRPAGKAGDAARLAVRADLASGMVEVQLHDAAATPAGAGGKAPELAGAADLFFHDGWRPPLSPPQLTRRQYERFLDDLDYGGNYGLFALRFRVSVTHMVRGRAWAEKVRDLGIEPREILYGMMWRDGLAKHCRRVGVRWDANDLEGSVRRVVEHYRK